MDTRRLAPVVQFHYDGAPNEAGAGRAPCPDIEGALS
jgi:hypothetical protein